ncbi:MAG: hypothetical protein Q9179_005627 [Wetmoreana sp. 5 TL-2023]
MAASIYPDYPPQTTPEQHDFLLSNIKDWSILNGLAVRPSTSFVSADVNRSGSLAVTAPVTLFPSLFPTSCFVEARAIQIAYSELYATIARDRDWLRKIVEELIEVDDFIAKLWNVHLAVEKEGYVQDLSLGLFRSDYMVHKEPEDPNAKSTIKQVEFNTIASSFGGLSAKVSGLHSYLHSISAYPHTSASLIDASSLPANPSITSLAHGLATAYGAYGPSKSSPKLPLCILFVVQSAETNIFDQLALSTHLQTHHGIPTFHLPFSVILAHTKISPDSHRILTYRPPHSPRTSYEVTLCYFRAGYSPAEKSNKNSQRQTLRTSPASSPPPPPLPNTFPAYDQLSQPSILSTPRPQAKQPSASPRIRNKAKTMFSNPSAKAAGTISTVPRFRLSSIP